MFGSEVRLAHEVGEARRADLVDLGPDVAVPAQVFKEAPPEPGSIPMCRAATKDGSRCRYAVKGKAELCRWHLNSEKVFPPAYRLTRGET